MNDRQRLEAIIKVIGQYLLPDGIPINDAMSEIIGLVDPLPPQREWIGLTEEDRNDCLVSADPCECLAKPESHQLMEDVEAKLREKNT